MTIEKEFSDDIYSQDEEDADADEWGGGEDAETDTDEDLPEDEVPDNEEGEEGDMEI